MRLQGVNRDHARPYNRRLVLDTVRRHGPLTRAEVARRVGLTLQTVSTIAGELAEAGLLVSHAPMPGRRGQPAQRIALAPGGGLAAGVSVTPRGIEAAAIDLGGRVLARRAAPLPPGGPDAAFAEIGRLVAGLGAAGPASRRLGVGMAMPGPFGVAGMSFVGPTTMEGWDGIDLAARLGAATGLPAFVAPDVAAAAQGEQLYGAGRLHRDFYYLYLGIGLGGRHVGGDGIRPGAWGNAGEVGHLPLVPDGLPCPCGNRGCLERYVSAEAFERVGGAADPAAWAAAAAPVFRRGLAAIENLFDPGTTVIATLLPEAVLDALIAAAEPLLPSVSARADRAAPRLTRSLSGADAVLRGAAAIAVSRALAPLDGTLFTETLPLAEPA